MKKPAFFYLIIFFVFLNVVDMLTTIIILPGESNPLYLLTKSFIGILIAKLIVVGAVIWLYIHNKYKNNTSFFIFVCVIVYGSLALFLAQIINISAILHPQVIVEAAKLTTTQKTSSYNTFMLFVYLLPIIFSTICFVIYDKSVKFITIIKKKGKIKRK